MIGGRENTQRRESLEIDAIAKRQNDTVTVGAEVRVPEDIARGVGRRSSLAYAPNFTWAPTSGRCSTISPRERRFSCDTL